MAVRFYEALSADAANTVHQMTRVSFELKDSLKALLDNHSCTQIEELHAKLKDQLVTVHPAWDHYLAYLTIQNTLQDIRLTLNTYLQDLNNAKPDEVISLPESRSLETRLPGSLIESLVDHYGSEMREDIVVFQDAIAMRLNNDVDVYVRASDLVLVSVEWMANNQHYYVDNAPDGRAFYFDKNGQRSEIKSLNSRSTILHAVKFAMGQLAK